MYKKNTITSKRSLCLLILGLITFGAAIGQESLADMVARIKPSVVAISTFDADGDGLKTGSGFVIRADYIVTNKHVVEGASRIDIRTAEGRVFRVKKFTLDEPGDLALLQIDRLPSQVRALAVAKYPPRQGDKVVVVGSPLGLEGSVSDGIVAAFREGDGMGKLVQITAPISAGSSGSPVINTWGDVIGVATLNLKGGQNLNFAISSERIISLWSAFVTVSNNGQPISSISNASSLTANDLLMRGMQLHKTGQCSEALSYFRDAIRISGGLRDAYLWAGACSYQLQQYDEAIEFLNQAIRLDSSNYHAHHHLGLAYYSTKRYASAVTAFQRAIQLAPENSRDKATTIYSLGLTYYALRDMGSAWEQKRLLDSLDTAWAQKLSALLTPNVSGYWTFEDHNVVRIKIVDDGIRVSVSFLGGDSGVWFEGVWENNSAIGFSKWPHERKKLYKLKKQNINQLKFENYGDMNPSDGIDKLRTKLKSKTPVSTRIWRKIE